jgi:hypothetical protein
MKKRLLATAVVLPALALAVPALATHSWATYHWARTANPFTLKLGDNVTAAWDSYLATTSSDWTASTVLNTTIVAGSAGNPRRCNAVIGTVQVCNATYGNNGWLGIASISITGGTHITQGTVKLNDTYFNTATYNTPAWRNLVSCQEVGHTFGLDHQDENFNNANLNTCMDYTNNPASNQHPNAHDYEQLELIYSHLDSSTTVGAGVPTNAAAGDTPGEWGRAIHFTADGRPDKFERIDGPGAKTITHVFWAIGEGPRGNR